MFERMRCCSDNSTKLHDVDAAIVIRAIPDEIPMQDTPIQGAILKSYNYSENGKHDFSREVTPQVSEATTAEPPSRPSQTHPAIIRAVSKNFVDNDPRLRRLETFLLYNYQEDFEALEADLATLKKEREHPAVGGSGIAIKATISDKPLKTLSSSKSVFDAFPNLGLAGIFQEEEKAKDTNKLSLQPPTPKSSKDAAATEPPLTPKSPTAKEDKACITTRLEALAEGVPSKSLQIDINNPAELTSVYNLTKKLGAGSFGTVWLAALKVTGAIRAVKTISKSKMKGNLRLLQREIEVFKMLDHPNIVKLYEIFDDDQDTHLVMELCSGGELRKLVPTNKGMKPELAAIALQQVFRAVMYLHASNVCHRDLKAENVMLSGNAGDKELKHRCRVTDFGLSCVYKPGQILKVDCGSPTHMSPEVWQKHYDYRCDYWSCGVMLYELLGGRKQAPFAGPSPRLRDVLIKHKTTRGQLPFYGGWVDQSAQAIDLVQKMLHGDIDKRLTLAGALEHPWFQKHSQKPKMIPLSESIVHNLRGYRSLNKFKKAALSIIASLMHEQDISMARDAFLVLDQDGNGSVSASEVREFLHSFKPEDCEAHDVDDAVVSIFFQPGAPGVGKNLEGLQTLRKRQSFLADKGMPEFSYTEFLAATINRAKINDEVCRVAFQCFDKNGDGTLSREELMHGRLLGQLGPDERDQLVEEIDANGDGEIDFEEFKGMMQDDSGFLKTFGDQKRQNGSKFTRMTSRLPK